MNLWETLLHPDREELEGAERREVGRAANILQVGEFQVLQLAYRAWHNKDLPEALVDRLFHAYMIGNDVPHWARHYARQILRLEAAGRLDINHAQYHCFDRNYGRPVPTGRQRFWAAAGCVVALLGTVVAVAGYSAGSATSPFPPYFSEKELHQTSGESGSATGYGADFSDFGRADTVGQKTGP